MNDYRKLIQHSDSLDALFEIWKKKRPDGDIDHIKDYFIADGIVNPNIWMSGKKKKILFVLKEAYGTDWETNTLATWLKNFHPKHRMWKRIARWVNGIQNTTEKSILRYKPELTDLEHNDALEQIAVLNIKKSKGRSNSNYEEIRKYASYDSEEIKKEFELIDADIIICGSVFATLNENVYKGELKKDMQSNDNWYYYLNVAGKERLFIDYYHPANHWSDLVNYYGLLGIYQQALIEKSS